MIEDEDVVIEVTQAMLEMLGYRVMVAKTGKNAVHITETFDGQIDLALLDIKLPDMEGGKVYPLIIKARPDLKVIVFSGYSIDGPARKILDAGAQDFIQKPFSLTTLSEKLKAISDSLKKQSSCRTAVSLGLSHIYITRNLTGICAGISRSPTVR